MPADPSDPSALQLFMPHGYCLLWQSDVLMLHVLSDALIALSYFSIPITLAYMAFKRKDFRFRWIFMLFGVFILACGATHLMGIWTIWHPDYLVEGSLKFITGLASLGTAVVLWTLAPEILRIPSPSDLERANARLQDEIAERTRHEQRVTLLNSQLEKRVEERTQSLRAVNDLLRQEVAERKQAEDALRDRDRRKDEFLATLAHELRNPLAPIRNACELLKLQPGQAEVARELIDRQLYQLTRLVDDLLDVARITHGQIKLKKTRVELAEILKRAAQTVRPLTDARKQSLSLELPQAALTLEADPVRLTQVVSNLLDNAAKYTGKHGHIRLSLEQQGDEAVIEVQDDGAGIAPSRLESVFDLFAQGNPGDNLAQGGLGLGLTLVRRLLAMHGGSIQAFSAGLGTGSRFLARLPLAPPQPDQPRPETALGPAMQARRILVVDDNQDSADSLKMYLQAAGHDVRVAYGGQAALETAENFAPTVAIVDIGMAEMNGYEVAEAIRRRPSLKSILLIALTGYGQEEDLRRAKVAGFDHHFLKPVDVDALSEILTAV